MRKKLLIAGGCSYTDANFLSLDKNIKQESWPMWPEHLGKDLGLDVINTGHSGDSNETIFHNVMEQILLYKKRIDLVTIAWTEFDRHRFFGLSELMPLSETIISLKQNPLHPDGLSSDFDHRTRLGMPDLMFKIFSSNLFPYHRNQYIKTVLQDGLRYMLMMAEYCKAHGINYIFSSALSPFNRQMYNQISVDLKMTTIEGIVDPPKTSKNEYIHLYTGNPFFGSLEKNHKNNFIGWPLVKPLGGYTIDDARYNGLEGFEKMGWNAAKIKYDVSEKDFHPNEEGQQIIGKMYYNKFKERYR